VSLSVGALDAQHVVAHLHEGEQVDLRGNDGFLRLGEVEFRVGEGLESFTALFLGDVAGTLEVVEREDVLEFLVCVHN
jgi:hypothetical protein